MVHVAKHRGCHDSPCNVCQKDAITAGYLKSHVKIHRQQKFSQKIQTILVERCLGWFFTKQTGARKLLFPISSKCISRTGIGQTKTCPPYTTFGITYTKNGGAPIPKLVKGGRVLDPMQNFFFGFCCWNFPQNSS